MVQGHSADELDVEMHHFPRHWLIACGELRPAEPTRGVFHDGEGFWEDLIQGGLQFVVVIDLGKLILPGRCLLFQSLIWKALKAFLDLIDLLNGWPHPFEDALVLGANQFLRDPLEHRVK